MQLLHKTADAIKLIKPRTYPDDVMKYILYDLLMIETKRMGARCNVYILSGNERVTRPYVWMGGLKLSKYVRYYYRFLNKVNACIYIENKEIKKDDRNNKHEGSCWKH